MKSIIDYSNIKDIKELYDYFPDIKQSLIIEANEDDVEGTPQKNADKREVIYADTKDIYHNIFKNIIIFTNDDDPKSNKTLKNIVDAVKDLEKHGCDIIPELHVFIAADTMCDELEDGKLNIYDSDHEYMLDKESNIDTLIFSRLGVQGEDQCETIVKVLQDRGFLVLNPVRYSELACNKYESAVLFDKGDIPQPKFALMTKDILYDEELFKEAMKDIYKDWDFKDNDKNEKFDVVVKILDGHGGTGVALVNGKRLYAILQLIFAVDKDLQLLLQKKEEADGGDIRVHVLTLRDKQVILAAMKRVKLGGDFRSNVSLGAQAEPVKLTPEQEQIALKTAAISKLPWCAVDIMPIVKGSNKELGDNAVLEINASPGTAGITEVMKVNFVNILLNQLDDPGQFVLQDKNAGFIESVKIKFDDNLTKEFLAKLDTGNSTGACTLEVGKFEVKNGYIHFEQEGKKFKFKQHGHIKALAGEKVYERPTIQVPELIIGQRKVTNAIIALVEHRDNKQTNILINRDTLSKLGYVIHPYQTHILTKEIQKVKIIN